MTYDLEMWVPIFIKGEKTKYSVSQYGRVMNTKTQRILKPQKISGGYLAVNLSIRNKAYTKKIHRLVATAFLPNPDNLPEVDHLDCNKKNNRVSNLEWVLSKTNKKRAHKNGLYKGRKGSDSPTSKFTDNQIKEMCKLMDENILSRDDILKKTGVSIHTMNLVRHGRLWKHIACDYDFTNFNRKILENAYKGSKNAHSRYADEQIIKVCDLLVENIHTYEEISNMTNVSKSTISHIKNRSIWKHITSKYDFSHYDKTFSNQYRK